MKTKYTQRIDGEGFDIPNRTVYKLACCDCGLVHQIVLASPGVRKGVGIGFACKRDNRATAQRRKKKTIKEFVHNPISEKDLQKMVDSMPGGLDGFRIHWGWLQFARKIERAHKISR